LRKALPESVQAVSPMPEMFSRQPFLGPEDSQPTKRSR